jgi:hypothetical protein
MKARRKIFRLMVLNKNGYKVIKFIANYQFQVLAMTIIKYQFNVEILERQGRQLVSKCCLFFIFFSTLFSLFDLLIYLLLRLVDWFIK